MLQRLMLTLCLLMPPTCIPAHEPLIGVGTTLKADPIPSAKVHCLQVPLATRRHYPNPDGSCVFLSMGVSGIQSNDPKCQYLPFDSAYGTAERGGANPERVAHVCAKRAIHAYNVTGKYSIPMARYAVATGRGCAIGFDHEHFQAVWGYDYARQVWLIWDNRYPDYITEYSESEFEAMHDRSGRWVVVNERPGDRIPRPVEW